MFFINDTIRSVLVDALGFEMVVRTSINFSEFLFYRSLLRMLYFNPAEQSNCNEGEDTEIVNLINTIFLL